MGIASRSTGRSKAIRASVAGSTSNGSAKADDRKPYRYIFGNFAIGAFSSDGAVGEFSGTFTRSNLLTLSSAK